MKKTKVLVSLIVLTLLFSVAGSTFAKSYKSKGDFVKAAKKQIKGIDCVHADKLLGNKGVIFLDVREPAEYKAGHIKGAINIPRGLLEFKIASKIKNKSAKIIVYCKTGGRGALATYTLKQMGYSNVKNLDGGWLGWSKYLKKKSASSNNDDEEEEGC